MAKSESDLLQTAGKSSQYYTVLHSLFVDPYQSQPELLLGNTIKEMGKRKGKVIMLHGITYNKGTKGFSHSFISTEYYRQTVLLTSC